MHGTTRRHLNGLQRDDPLHRQRLDELFRIERVEQRRRAECDPIQIGGQTVAFAVEFGEVRSYAADDGCRDPGASECISCRRHGRRIAHVQHRIERHHASNVVRSECRRDRRERAGGPVGHKSHVEREPVCRRARECGGPGRRGEIQLDDAKSSVRAWGDGIRRCRSLHADLREEAGLMQDQ